jgi:sugar phosphate isomerase/epimerase
MLSRRDFIRKTGIAAAALCIPVTGFSSQKIKTGLALYTLRDGMMTDQDSTLTSVSEIGYYWVEAAGYSDGLFYNQTPFDFRRRIEDHGLKLLSSHSEVNGINIDKAVSSAAEAGIRYLVLPSLPAEWRKSPDGYKAAADFFNRAGEKCIKSGMRFCYHNHRTEFKKLGGLIPYDILLTETDPALVAFELDLCWMSAEKQSPIEYINNYPGRFELIHLKDMSANRKDATLGEGVIDFPSIFSLAEKAGMKYFFVEQDNCRTHSPMESIKISHDYILKNLIHLL